LFQPQDLFGPLLQTQAGLQKIIGAA